jgi:hypothetical protein
MTRARSLGAVGSALLVVLCVPVAGRPALQATASLSGQVTSLDASTPIPRAIVTVSGEGIAQARSVVTDDSGQFTCEGLPAGRFLVTVSKAMYVTTAYGAKRPGRPGTAITVTNGQQVKDVNIRLGRMAAISGTVRDGNEIPVAGATVVVMAAAADRVASLLGTRMTVTDDRGAYRLSGLTPGSYVIASGATYTPGLALSDTGIGVRSSEEVDAILSALERGVRPPAAGPASPSGSPGPRAAYTFAATFFQSSGLPTEAGPITLGLGEERGGIDLSVKLVRVAAVSGEVLPEDSRTMGSAAVRLTRADWPVPLLIGGRAAYTADTDPSGKFSFTSVLPGRYVLSARTSTFKAAQADGSGDWNVAWAIGDVTVNGEDVTGVALRLQPSATLSGKVAFAAAATPPEFTGIRVTATPKLTGPGAMRDPTLAGPQAADVERDGSFALTGLAPGTYAFTVTVPDSSWRLRSAMIRGVDGLDVPIELAPGDAVRGSVFTLSNEHSELAGMLTNAAGASAPEYYVIAFPQNPALWSEGSRRVAVTRPSTDGSFHFMDLPGGDYLVAALTDVEDQEWNDSSFLRQLVSGAAPAKLADGERRTLTIRIAGK